MISTPDPVAIIGGGIGGLATANALQRVGIPYRLYEQAPALTDVGAGIGLSAGALRILDVFGLGADARAMSAEVVSVAAADHRLRVRRWLPGALGSRCIHRADLIDLLKANVPADRVALRQRAVAVESSADGATVVFDDGSRARAACVVAADGIQSALRAATFPEVKVRPIGQTIWRGITDGPAPNGLTGTYVEIWHGGLRFLIAPLSRERTFWLAVKPAPPGEQDDPTTLKEHLVSLFADYHPGVHELIRNTSGPILRNDMADLGPPRRGWHRGRLVFLGDAIHATTPNLAQGGCQAIEDALCLALCLDVHGGAPARASDGEAGAYGAAFEAYHALRHRKVGSIVRTSWTFGRAAHASNPVFHYGFRWLMEHAPDAVMERQGRMLNDLTYLKPVDRRGLLAAVEV